jgi:hypothetical protein
MIGQFYLDKLQGLGTLNRTSGIFALVLTKHPSCSSPIGACKKGHQKNEQHQQNKS